MNKWIWIGVTGIILLSSGALLSLRSLQKHNDRMLRLLPHNEAKFRALCEAIEKTGNIVVITSSYRSTEEQERLYRENPKNAKPGSSPHEHSRAIDINLITVRGWVHKSDSVAKWNQTGVPQLAKKMGFRWGGDFTNYHDPVHFEIPKSALPK